ncbi:MAG: hypothetical protein GY820_39620 [Gammaproteobacteria bacterium]|nr:hypothetical protein [Gammaproteobacteria bacterium]
MKSGTYRVAYTYAQYNDAGTMVYESGRSEFLGPFTVTESFSYGGTYSTNARINKIRIFSTTDSGSVYYLEQVIANSTGGGDWWVTLSMADATLRNQATAYWTGKTYETKRLYVAGAAPALAYVVEASGRLWGCGRMTRTGTSEASTLYWSELAPLWEDWPLSNANNRFAQPLTGLYESDELIYVFTKDSRWKVTPAVYNEGLIFDKLEGSVGCLGHHTIAKHGTTMIWLGQEGFYASVGNSEPQLISGQIKSSIESIRKDRARHAVAIYDPDAREYRCWVATDSSTMNNQCFVADFSSWPSAPPRWYIHGGKGRTVYSIAQGVMPDGERHTFDGDHLGCVYQEDVGYSDGASVGGTYQGSVGTTTTTSTTTTTT